MAVNCSVVPSGIVGIAGVTAIETNTAGLMVRVVEPLIAPKVAVTVVAPKATLLATPRLVTVAMPLLAVVQVAVISTSVLPSL